MHNGNGGGKGLIVRHKILFGREFGGAKVLTAEKR